jgi:hypothetical protein
LLLEKKEVEYLTEKGIEAFMLEKKAEDEEFENMEQIEPENYCPYCGQTSPVGEWWTDEQQAYIKAHIENIVNQLLNEDLIRPLKRKFEGSSSELISMKFEEKELKQKEPWISPETNDMDIFELLCCNRKIKIREDWEEKVYCFFCGFPHNNNKASNKA